MRNPFYGLGEPTPGPEPGLSFLTFRSPALGGRRGDVTLYVPPGPAEPVGLALLLHGVNASHYSWAMKGSAHRTADALVSSGEIAPMILAMPSDGLFGNGSGYVPHHDADYERWIVDDVPAAVLAALGITRELDLFITGLSMGGYGSLRLGAKYAERFRAIAAHSSVVEFATLGRFVSDPPSAYETASAQERDVLHQMRAHRDVLPPLRFDCGTEDSLLPESRALHEALTRDGIAHEYREYPGGHEWTYWAARVEETLHFFDGNLSVRNSPQLQASPTQTC